MLLYLCYTLTRQITFITLYKFNNINTQNYSYKLEGDKNLEKYKRLNQSEKNYFDNHFLNSLNQIELTQASVAKNVGVIRDAIVQWKSQNSYPHVEMFIKLADLFN